MLKTLKFTLILLIVSGCRREYAHFQKTTVENYHKPKKQAAKQLHLQEISVDSKVEAIEALPIPDDETLSAGIETGVPTGQSQVHEKTDLFPKGWFRKKKKTSDSRKTGLFQKEEKKGLFQKKKPKKRKNGLSHRSIVRLEIGFIILGIAVVFALLHINILAIIFGLLSAFMIIRGLRKVL